MSAKGEKTTDDKSLGPQLAASQSPASICQGDINNEDAAIREFYGSAISETYRLKSELVAQHLAEIGMGK